MGYTKFALKYLTLPGEVMPKCCGDRVVEFDISINSEITLCPDSSSACLFIITPSDLNEDEINAKSPIEWGANQIMVDGTLLNMYHYTHLSVYKHLRNFLDGQLCFPMWKDFKSEIKLDLKTIANKYPKIKVYMYDFSNDDNFYMPTPNIVPNPHKAVQTLNFV